MTRVEAFELDVQNLTAGELALFHDWFAEYDAAKLNELAAEARAGHERGETTRL